MLLSGKICRLCHYFCEYDCRKPASTWISCIKKQLSELNISFEEAKRC